MKPFLVFGISALGALAFALPAAAQHGGRSSALGGSLAPRGAMSHPLGGFTGSGASVGANRGYRGAVSGAYRGSYGYSPYGYSFYVPGYFDYLDSDPYWDSYYGASAYGYGAPAPAASYSVAPGLPVAPQQPVIINQFFGAQAPPPQSNGPQPSENPQTSGAPIGSPQNYYLIAYKNHAVYSALAYWVEDKTLHYVTTQNTHNQASLDLIDLSLTKTLNQSNDVPFSIPGQ